MIKVRVPNKIKLVTHPYRIVYNQHLRGDDNWDGLCNKRTQEIQIDPGLPPSKRDVVLWHEIIEAQKDVYNIKLDHDDIDRIAQAVMDFLSNGLGIELDWMEIS